MRKSFKELLCAIPIVFITLLDVYVKRWVTAHVRWQDDVALIPGVAHLTYVENTGAAFGILANARWMFVVLGAIVMAAILWFVFVKKVFGSGTAVLISMSLVYAGTLGNWLDRLLKGYVVDMFELEFMRFGIFNVADMALTCGAVLFCVWMLFNAKDKRESE
ncbi:lipoprotein signal peptidase [Clostridia bacterium]|nr:lipoprotein signal peptidase [Clostridia bacterium]